MLLFKESSKKSTAVTSSVLVPSTAVLRGVFQTLFTYRQIFKALKLRRAYTVEKERHNVSSSADKASAKGVARKRASTGKAPKVPKFDFTGLDREVIKAIKAWVPTRRPDMAAGNIMRALKLARNQQRERVIGAIPGVLVGDRFKLREVSQCCVVRPRLSEPWMFRST